MSTASTPVATPRAAEEAPATSGAPAKKASVRVPTLAKLAVASCSADGTSAVFKGIPSAGSLPRKTADHGDDDFLDAALNPVVTHEPVTAWQKACSCGLPDAHSVGKINAVAFRGPANGDEMATAGDDKSVLIWDDEEPVARLDGHKSQVTSLAVNPTGSFLVTGSVDRTSMVWAWPKAGKEGRPEPLRILIGHTKAVTSVAIGTGYIVTGSKDRTVNVYKNKATEPTHILRGHDDTVNAVALWMPSGKGKKIASASDDGSVRLWSLTTGKCERIIGDAGDGPADQTSGDLREVGATYRAVAFHPTSGDIAIATSAGVVDVYSLLDAESTAPVLRVETPGTKPTCVAWSPGVGGFLFAGGEDGITRAWRSHGRQRAGVLVLELLHHTKPVLGLAVAELESAAAKKKKEEPEEEEEPPPPPPKTKKKAKAKAKK